MNEQWKFIKDYPNYKISNTGQVFSLAKRKIISQRNNGRGYLYVSLYKNGKGKKFYIHRLVGLYFLEKEKYKIEINHIDGNKQNNNAKNLEWCTRSENCKHAWEKGLRKVTSAFLECSKRNIAKALNDKNVSKRAREKLIETNKSRGKKAYTLDQKKSFISLYCLELKRAFLTASRVEEKLGIKQNTILCSIKRGHKTCGGYHWKILRNRWT